LTLLDASALLSLLLGQPAEAEVQALLRRGNCAVPAPCLGEVVDKLIRKRGVEPVTVSERLEPLLDEVVAVVATDRRIAWRAGELHAEHYDRATSALSLADCTLLASAQSDDKIATSDTAVAATARKLALDVVALPDSSGRRPQID
jgi:PIN domain nuclease of toxin-antitoxin system